jgi:polysaccharide chain length determinant protein (PEP-CTERM system associated)
VLPGKRYRPEDVLRIVTRRIWWLLIPWAVTAAATVVVARLLPDRFRSESIILVVPPRVPDSIVRSAVTGKIDTRLPSITQQILTRTRLERIIQDFDLYARERKKDLMENVVKGMRDDITVSMVKGDAFFVRYESYDARTAMRVTERLASLFVEDNLRDREVLAEGTNQFLESQLDDARRRLLEHEKKLEEYRKKYSNELPSQMQSNVQSAQNTQNQAQAVSESINRDRDRRLMLERMIAEIQGDAPSPDSSQASTAAVVDSSMSGESIERQLDAARSSMQALLLRLTPEHPDIVRAKRRIAELEKKAEDNPTPSPAPRVPVSGAVARQNRLRDLRTEIETLDREIVRKQESQSRLQTLIAEYQRRAESSPTRESELIALTRDYDTLQKVYNTLLGKAEEARLAANLEHRQIGEQFKIIDPARLSEQPFSPERLKIAAGGLIAGLIVGLALIASFEVRDTTFQSDVDVVAVLSLPVLALVPAIITAAERRAMLRLRLIVGLATVLVLASGGALAWKLHLQDWLR